MTQTYKGLTREAAKHLEAGDICQYLLDEDWNQFTDLPERVVDDVAIFRRMRDGALEEVVVPLKPEQREHYFRRMAEAISDLAGYEDRPARRVFEKLANGLRPQREPQQSSFIGTVDELSGTPGADGRPKGQVTLRLQDQEDLVTARVNLDADDYASAARAHLSNHHIKIWGTLQRRARLHKITRYERFEVVAGSPG